MTGPHPDRHSESAGTHGSTVLDNVAWHALTGPHASFAEGSGGARRYRSDVSVFHAMADDDAGSWADLAALVGPHGTGVVFRALPITPPPEWETVFVGDGLQMVSRVPPVAPTELPAVDADTGRTISLRALSDGDVPAMTALIELTEPGPFRPRTIELGGYVGILHDDELVAMAGQRMNPAGFCEISAVCTHPGTTAGTAASRTGAGTSSKLLTAASVHPSCSVC
jgi:hypothetical protein